MRDNSDKIHLERILDSISRIESHVEGLDFSDFENDLKSYDSVLAPLMSIGEMVNRLSDEFRENHANFPWHKIIGMRNQIAHGYFEIKADTIWKTITTDLPELKQEIENILG